MNTKDLIGNIITNIFVWSELEFGGLDRASVFIELNHRDIIRIPWGMDDEDLQCDLNIKAESLFEDLSDIPIVSIAPNNRTPSFIKQLRNFIGLNLRSDNKFKIIKTKYIENKVKYLRNQKIVDFIMFVDSESTGCLELENGYIITETMVAPHGTGTAGLNFYTSISHFEEYCGTDYRRLIANN